MRVTNQIMTNNTLAHINNNKLALSNIEDRYNTGKKVQRPSDDPVIAIRALKLRNNLSEIKQYFKKNVPDARSWLQLTESTLVQVSDICTTLHTLSTQGAQDTLTLENRQSIIKTMKQYREQIYVEGNASYAGRFVFTGFKTDTSLSFQEEAKDRQYTITEELTPADLKTTMKTFGGYQIEDYEGGNVEFTEEPKNHMVHSLRIAYDNLDAGDDEKTTLSYLDKDGEWQTIDLKFEGPDAAGEEKPFTSNSYSSYEKPEEGAKYIADSGEIILSDSAYELLKDAKSFKITYQKTDFKIGDVRPEHYFDCVSTKLDEEGNPSEAPEDSITYTKEDQDIFYDISFNQRLQINTQAKDSITHEIGRELDSIFLAVNDVEFTEDKIAKADKILKTLKNAGETENKENIDKVLSLKKQLETELALKKKVMQERFSKSLDNIKGFQDKINKSISDLGSREVRLNLTESRLSSQTDDFTELMSSNEDADLVETIVEFNAQQVLYNASLMASSKVVQNTLLDFLR